MPKKIKKYSKIAVVVGLTVTLVAMYILTPIARAGSLTNKEVRLSDTRLSATSVNYDFLATESAAQDIKCIKISFCDETAIGGSCTAPDNMDTTGATTTSPSGWNNLNPQYWEIEEGATTSNTLMASTSQASEQLGTDGSFVIGGLTNPDATSSYFAWIQTFSDESCTTEVDRGVAGYYIMSGVVVTATVGETLSVTVNASTCADFMDGTPKETAATSIDYGSVNSGTFYDACQRIDIGTNAASGYIARVHKTQPLTYGSNIIDDGDCDGGCGTSTDDVWTNTGNAGFGYCMKDRTLNGAAVADADWATYGCAEADDHFKIVSITAASAEPIMQSGSATSTNSAWINYRLAIDSSLPAGQYTTTIIYTVTPKY